VEDYSSSKREVLRFLTRDAKFDQVVSVEHNKREMKTYLFSEISPFISILDSDALSSEPS